MALRGFYPHMLMLMLMLMLMVMSSSWAGIGPVAERVHEPHVLLLDLALEPILGDVGHPQLAAAYSLPASPLRILCPSARSRR